MSGEASPAPQPTVKTVTVIGTDPEVSEWAGHNSVAFTLTRYGGLFEDGSDDAVDRLDALLADRPDRKNGGQWSPAVRPAGRRPSGPGGDCALSAPGYGRSGGGWQCVFGVVGADFGGPDSGGGSRPGRPSQRRNRGLTALMIVSRLVGLTGLEPAPIDPQAHERPSAA